MPGLMNKNAGQAVGKKRSKRNVFYEATGVHWCKCTSKWETKVSVSNRMGISQFLAKRLTPYVKTFWGKTNKERASVLASSYLLSMNWSCSLYRLGQNDTWRTTACSY